MKGGKTHRVPLSAPALAILDEMRALRWNDHPFVFPGERPRKHLSNMALKMTMRRLGAGEFTPHGMRSAFRDWATEIGEVEYATAERCLAHAVGNDAALSYDRTDRLALRRPVMIAWAKFLIDHAADRSAEKVEASMPEMVTADQ
jgi:integrase